FPGGIWQDAAARALLRLSVRTGWTDADSRDGRMVMKPAVDGVRGMFPDARDRRATMSLVRAFSIALGALVLISGNALPAAKKSLPSASGEVSPPTGAPALEPKAIDILKAASARLAAAHSMTFTAVATYESPSTVGPPIAYTTTSDVTLQRPDKL